MSIQSAGLHPGVAAEHRNQGSTPELKETHWGYVLRGSAGSPLLIVIAQVVVAVIGAICLVGAFGMWIVPGAVAVGLDIRIGISTLSLCTAIALLWYASRGVEVEWQIDTMRGEVRQVLRNHDGSETVLAHYGFDAIGGVVMDRVARRGELPNGHANLVMRLGNSMQLVPLVAGPESKLAPLRDRLGRDLIVAPAVGSRHRLSDLRLGQTQSA